MIVPDHCTQRLRGDRYMTGNRYRNPRLHAPVLYHEPLTPEQQDAIAQAKARWLACAICSAPPPHAVVEVEEGGFEARCAEHLP